MKIALYVVAFLLYTGTGAFLAGVAEQPGGWPTWSLILLWPFCFYVGSIKAAAQAYAKKAKAFEEEMAKAEQAATGGPSNNL